VFAELVGLCKGSVVPENFRNSLLGHVFSSIQSMSEARLFNSKLIRVQFLVRHRPVYEGGLKNKTTQFSVNRISAVSLNYRTIKAYIYIYIYTLTKLPCLMKCLSHRAMIQSVPLQDMSWINPFHW
jgi:hypothetical protein